MKLVVLSGLFLLIIKTMVKKLVALSLILTAFSALPLAVEATTLYLMPSQQSVYKGDTFIVEIRLDTEKEEINVVEANLTFSPNLLEVKDLIIGNSILSLWLKEPSFSNKSGIISLIGGTPTGFNGDGLIGSIVFLVKKTGKTALSLGKNSKVLLNDGEGKSAKLNFSENNYNLIKKVIKETERPPKVFSESHSDQNKWYRKKDFKLHWDLVNGIQYSYLLSKDPLAEPDDIPDKPKGKMVWMGNIKYQNLADGIYYFTIKQKLPGKNWSETERFRIMIDTTAPEEFWAKITEIEKKNYLVFNAIDKVSGIDHYEILETKKPNYWDRFFEKKKEQEWKIGKTPYLLNDQTLKSVIKVKAVDKAGNERIIKIISPKKPFLYWFAILTLIGIGLIWRIIKKIRTKPR